MLGATLLCAAACRASQPGTRPVVPITLTGYFNVIVGDPLPPAQSPRIVQYLTTPEGRTYSVAVDSAGAVTSGDVRRFHGAMVRVVGYFREADSTTIWIRRIDSLPRPPS